MAVKFSRAEFLKIYLFNFNRNHFFKLIRVNNNIENKYLFYIRSRSGKNIGYIGFLKSKGYILFSKNEISLHAFGYDMTDFITELKKRCLRSYSDIAYL